MNILYDENMPYAPAFFAEFGECQSFVGRALDAEQVKDADVLLVRSITQVNQALLHRNTRLKFVGTATIGVDHIDQSYLTERGTAFASAPGCNAKSVADYVISSLMVVAERNQWDLQKKTVAIVGAGNIGTRLAAMLDGLGMAYMLCDPPLAESGDPRDFVSFEQALSADIISLHVPITQHGKYKTAHMFNESTLATLKEGQCLVNSCRGAVIDNQALLNVMRSGKALHLVMDVWENEPNINSELADYCEIATAHIAGYSTEGKGRGTEMLYHRLCQLLGSSPSLTLSQFLPEFAIQQIVLNEKMSFSDYAKLVHAVYDVRRDDALLRNSLGKEGQFDLLRKHYPTRRELSAVKISAGNDQQKKALYGLGFSL